MAFLSSETLKQRLPKIIGSAYEEDNIKHGAYELHLGSEVFITSNTVKTNLGENDQVEIPPGQFALLLTEEALTMPNDLIAFISMKFGIKFRGLINISGFHVDPGFRGRLKFSVYNAGSQPVVVSKGKDLFQIWFSTLDKATKKVYEGRHQDQDVISDEDVMQLRGDIASPAVLKNQIETLRRDMGSRLDVIDNKFSTLDRYKVGIVIGLVVMLLKLFVFDPLVSDGSDKASSASDRPEAQQVVPRDSIYTPISAGHSNQQGSKSDSSRSAKEAPTVSKGNDKQPRTQSENGPTEKQ